jgi:predicted RNase H-like HicB family nuclease
MTTKILLKPSDKLTDFSLTVLIEQETEGKYQALVLGLPECKAEGNTREEAIANLSQLVTNRLEKAELTSLEIQEQKPDRPALTVLIEQKTEGKYQALVLGLPECKAEGNSREEVITNISRILGDRLEKAELIPLEIKPPKPEHPWMKFAGMFKDDPQFDEMLEDIQQLRRDRDAEMEEYYRKMDAEEAVK